MPNETQEKTTIVLNDEELDFDEAVGTEVETAEVDFEAILKASVEKAKKQSMAYTDTRIEQVNQKLLIHQQTLEAHTTSITNIEQVLEAMVKGGNVQAIPLNAVEKKPKGILDVALGTVGGVLHGVVDTAAFICESAVDLVTLGRARRQEQ
jgi:hypothetical protein